MMQVVEIEFLHSTQELAYPTFPISWLLMYHTALTNKATQRAQLLVATVLVLSNHIGLICMFKFAFINLQEFLGQSLAI